MFDKAAARSQVPQTARKCLIPPQLAPQATSAHLPGRRSRSAPTASGGPVFCLTPTHKHTENKSNEKETGCSPVPPAGEAAAAPLLHLSLQELDSRLTVHHVKYLTVTFPTWAPPPAPPCHVMLNYLSLPNKRIAVTKHCKLDRMTNRWFLCCHLMREPESAQPPLHSERRCLVVSHLAAANVSPSDSEHRSFTLVKMRSLPLVLDQSVTSCSTVCTQ